MAQALERVVIQIDVRELDFALLQRVGIDGEVVVVRRDLDLAALDALHWMIAAVVAEFQLVCPATECTADELVSEADAENRSLAHESADIVARVIYRLGIAGAIRQKDTVGIE